MKTLKIIFLLLTLIVFIGNCAADIKESQFQKFVTDHVQKIEPMDKQANLASWKAANTGKPEDYDRVSELTLKIRKVYNDPNGYAFLKDIKDSGQVKSP
jgi:hypothetical protein